MRVIADDLQFPEGPVWVGDGIGPGRDCRSTTACARAHVLRRSRYVVDVARGAFTMRVGFVRRLHWIAADRHCAR